MYVSGNFLQNEQPQQLANVTHANYVGIKLDPTAVMAKQAGTTNFISTNAQN
jgi:hypothetical protein